MSSDPIAEKTCSHCKKTKPLADFYIDRKSKDGRSWVCSMCIKEKVRRWENENKERHHKNAKEWVAKNPELRRATLRRYYENHREEHLLKQKQAILANPEHVRAIKRKSSVKHRDTRIKYYWDNRELLLAKRLKHQREHPGMVRARKARYRAHKYAAEIRDFTHQQWVELQDRYDHRCAYCGKRFKGKLTQDHVIPLSKNGNHTLSNIVPACGPCNSSKGNRNAVRPVHPLLLSIGSPLNGMV